MTSIHPSLSARNISKLRSSLRPAALAAINGSTVDLIKLATALTSLPEEQASGLLPVIYVNTSASAIPDLDLLDRSIAESTLLPCITNAHQSISCLCSLARKKYSFIKYAALDLLPGVMAWLEFLHTYWIHLPTFHPFEQKVYRVAHAQLLLTFTEVKDERTEAAVYATPGFRKIVAGAWATMLQYDVHDSPSFAVPETTLKELVIHLFALGREIERRHNFDEILDAFGGSHSDLVATLRTHIKHAVAEAKTELAVGALNAVLVFLQHREGRHEHFTPSLLSGGIITSLVSALEIDGSAAPVAAFAHQMVDLDLALLIEYIKMGPGYKGLEEALHAGLIRHLLRFTPKIVQETRNGMHDDVQDLLSSVLLSGLVSYPILTLMKASLPDIETAFQNKTFLKSVLFKDWELLRQLIIQRVKVLDTWDGAGRPSFVACDNMKCTKIANKTRFKRCAACNGNAYCSPECQRADWHVAHRNTCPGLSAAGFNMKQMLRSRERAFLRALLHADYLRLRFQVCIQTISFIRAYPGEEYFVVFDYSEAGESKAEVCARSTLSPAEGAGQWARAARSDGRMTVHIMRIGMGKLNQQLIFPLRAETPRLQHGLRRIVSKIQALSTSQIAALVSALLQTADREGREIH
ncbi:hypothetical protein C8R46DRAFT_1349445 [Mycena filopes]|nr:hypothetical protein C8R46DRAFT_1349445 [Mycena filopes]